MGRYMVAHSRNWDEFEACLGASRRNPNRRSYRPYRLTMICFSIVAVVCISITPVIWTGIVMAVFVVVLCVSCYILSCDDPSPEPRPKQVPATRVLRPS